MGWFAVLGVRLFYGLGLLISLRIGGFRVVVFDFPGDLRFIRDWYNITFVGAVGGVGWFAVLAGLVLLCALRFGYG